MRRSAALVACLATIAVGCTSAPPDVKKPASTLKSSNGPGEPRIEIISPKPGDVVSGGEVEIRTRVRDFDLVDKFGKKKFDTDAYVDAWALRLGAASYYTKITADLRSIDATRATEIARDLQRIESVLPYPEPPDPPEPVDDLTTAVDRVAKALERVAGAVLVVDETGSRATA